MEIETARAKYSCARPWNNAPREAPPSETDLHRPCTNPVWLRAAAAVREYLSDGAWRPAAEVVAIVEAAGRPAANLHAALPILDLVPGFALSDSARWVCVPDDNTAEFAPDGT